MTDVMIAVVAATNGLVLGSMLMYVVMHHDKQASDKALYGMYLDEMYKRLALERRERSGEVMRQNKVRIIKRIDGEEVV